MNNIHPRIAMATIKHSACPLRFQIVEKAFHNGIVPAISLAAHTADHATTPQKILIIKACILRPLRNVS